MFKLEQNKRAVSSSEGVLIAVLNRLDSIDLVLDHAKCGINVRVVIRLFRKEENKYESPDMVLT